MLTATERTKIDRMNPASQEIGLGTEIGDTQDDVAVLTARGAVVFEKTIDASAAMTPRLAFTAPFAMRITDVIVRATANDTDGTLVPKKGTNAMCAGIPCAAAGTVSHMAADANGTYLTLDTGDEVNLQTGAGTAQGSIRGVVTFEGIRL